MMEFTAPKYGKKWCRTGHPIDVEIEPGINGSAQAKYLNLGYGFSGYQCYGWQ
jgi:hypothetical protein